MKNTCELERLFKDGIFLEKGSSKVSVFTLEGS